MNDRLRVPRSLAASLGRPAVSYNLAINGNGSHPGDAMLVGSIGGNQHFEPRLDFALRRRLRGLIVLRGISRAVRLDDGDAHDHRHGERCGRRKHGRPGDDERPLCGHRRAV